MRLLERIRESLDAPRFCPSCGKAIEVESRPRFHERTGEPRDIWYWHCPDVSVSVDGGAIQWEQRAVHRVDEHGQGRPRWHRLAAEAEQGGQA